MRRRIVATADRLATTVLWVQNTDSGIRKGYFALGQKAIGQVSSEINQRTFSIGSGMVTLLSPPAQNLLFFSFILLYWKYNL